jgi:hypothetical protein
VTLATKFTRSSTTRTKASPSSITDPEKISFFVGPERGKPQDATTANTATRATPFERRNLGDFTAPVSST